MVDDIHQIVDNAWITGVRNLPEVFSHNNVGTLYAERGRVDRALPHFEAAARIKPDDPDYRSNLERARRRGIR